MTVEAPLAQWIAAGMFVLSLPVWTFFWFMAGMVMGVKYSRWRDPPPKGPPLRDKVLIVAIMSYPLVTIALGAGAWICWSRGIHPAGFILTVFFVLAPSSIWLLAANYLAMGLWRAYRRRRDAASGALDEALVRAQAEADELEARFEAERTTEEEISVLAALMVVEAATATSNPAPAITALRHLLRRHQVMEPGLFQETVDRLRVVHARTLDAAVPFPGALRNELEIALAALESGGTCRCVAVYSRPRYNINPQRRTDIVFAAPGGRVRFDPPPVPEAPALGQPVMVHCRDCGRNWVVSVEDGPDGPIFSWRQWEGLRAEGAQT